MSVGRPGSHHAAHTAAHSAHAATHAAAGAARVLLALGREVAGGDDVVDLQDEVGGLAGGGDALLFRAGGLDDAGLEGVLDLAADDVQAGALLALAVGRAQV